MNISRRQAIKKAALGSFLIGSADFKMKRDIGTTNRLKNNIHQSACYWCYSSIPLDEFCKDLKRIGLSAIDLLKVDQLPVAIENGLTCSMCYGGDLGLYKGWNNPGYHETMLKNYEEAIPQIAKLGFRNVICFSGAREKGIDDEQGLKNCEAGLKKLLHTAEKYNVVMVMELLNSKIDHPHYMCDHTAWGVELCKRLGSEHFKLLYDIYHMQIMEGDIIRTIRENHPYFAHYHTGGVPGRHELDNTQELYYPAIMNAIKETGFEGFVAQEFVPTPKDNAGKIKSLQECVKICDI